MEIQREKNNVKISLHERICSVKYYSFHWHENFELFRVENYACKFWIDGVLVEAFPGDIICIGESQVHRFMIEQDDTRIFLLQFSPEVLLNAGAFTKPVKTHITAKEIGQMPYLDKQINMLFDMIEREGYLQKKSDNSFQEYLVCSLYCLLMRYFSDEINGGSIHAERQDFYKIVTYINEHYEDNINVNMLEETLFLYRAKMSRIFLKFAGMSIKEYIYMLRIKKANSLMNQGYGVTQAAMESGFGSIRTFNYVYKKMMGFKPSQYANKK